MFKVTASIIFPVVLGGVHRPTHIERLEDNIMLDIVNSVLERRLLEVSLSYYTWYFPPREQCCYLYVCGACFGCLCHSSPPNFQVLRFELGCVYNVSVLVYSNITTAEFTFLWYWKCFLGHFT